jgi:glutaminyl-tRNA synthetase
VRLYDHLFKTEDPMETPAGGSYRDNLNPNSLEVLKDARVEPSLANASPESRYQFERMGYFCVDSVDSKPGRLVFNRTTSLRDTWAKIEKKK